MGELFDAIGWLGVGAIALLLLPVVVVLAMVHTLLQLRFQEPAIERVDGADVPAPYWQLYQPLVAALVAQGFEPLSWYRVGSILASRWSVAYEPVLRSPDGSMLVGAELADPLSDTRPVNVSVSTAFEDGRWLVTHNHLAHALIGASPDDESLDARAPSLEGQLAFHREAVSARVAGGRAPVVPSPEAIAEAWSARARRGLEAMREAGEVASARGEHQLSLRAAVTKAWRLVTGGRGAPDLTRLLPVRFDAPLELQAEAVERHEERRHRVSGRQAWLWVLLASLGLSLVSFTGLFEIEEALALLVVLAVHEGGHYAAMRLCGYRNVRVFFIPFLGAATSGSPVGRTLGKEVLVLLAGPLPGIALAFAVSVTVAPTHPFLVDLLFWAVALNLLNLLPLFPLDGGRLVHALIADIHPGAMIALRLFALACFLALWLVLDDWLGGLMSFVVLSSMPVELRVASLERELRRDGVRDLVGVLARARARPGMTGLKVRTTVPQLLERLSVPEPSTPQRLIGGVVYGVALAGALAATVLVLWSTVALPEPERRVLSCEAPLPPQLEPTERLARVTFEVRYSSADEVTAGHAAVFSSPLGSRCLYGLWREPAPSPAQIRARRTWLAVELEAWDRVQLDGSLDEDAAPAGPDAESRRLALGAVRASGADWLDEEVLALLAAGATDDELADRLGAGPCEPGASVVSVPLPPDRTLLVFVSEPEPVEPVARCLCDSAPEEIAVTFAW